MANHDDRPRYFQIVLHPRHAFGAVRTIELGNGIERFEGKRQGAETWEVIEWLIDKALAHNERGRLVADDPAAQAVLDEIGALKHVRGDRYKVAARD